MQAVLPWRCHPTASGPGAWRPTSSQASQTQVGQVAGGWCCANHVDAAWHAGGARESRITREKLHPHPSLASFTIPCTGGIIALEIGHTGPEPWFVKEVLVVNETTGARGLFEVNRWVRDQRMALQASTLPIQPRLWPDLNPPSLRATFHLDSTAAPATNN